MKLRFDIDPLHTVECPDCREKERRLNLLAPQFEEAWEEIVKKTGVSADDQIPLLYAMLGRLMGRGVSKGIAFLKMQIAGSPYLNHNAKEFASHLGYPDEKKKDAARLLPEGRD